MAKNAKKNIEVFRDTRCLVDMAAGEFNCGGQYVQEFAKSQ